MAKKIKMKTVKAAKKRFKISKNGKIKFPKSFRRHLLADRSSKKKRQFRRYQDIDPTDAKKVKQMLPYDF